MSKYSDSGSIPSSQVVALRLGGYISKFDRKLVAALYGMDALWYLKATGKRELNGLSYPADFATVSPVRHIVYDATVNKDTPEVTAQKAQALFGEFVTLNGEAMGFDREIKFMPRDMSASRVPLHVLLELERLARPDRMFVEDPRMPADIMEVILNGGRGAINEEVHRPGVELSILLSSLCTLSPGNGVLDMSCGTGTLLARLLTDKVGIHAFGQETDGELAAISWLRLHLHPAAVSAHVRAGDPLRYSYSLNADRRPIDVALVHSVEMGPDDEQAASINQRLRIAEEEERHASWQQVELQHRLNRALSARDAAMLRYDASESKGMTEAQAEDFRKERTEVLRSLEGEIRDLRQRAESQAQVKDAIQQSLKVAKDLQRKTDAGRTYELITEGLTTVGPAGMVIAVVLARNLFKSPQVDRIRKQVAEQGNLDLVVELPRGVDAAEERLAVLVFRKGRSKDDPILFVDATDHDSVKRASRDAFGEQADLIGAYRRSRSTVLTPAFFSSVSRICLERVPVPGLATLVQPSVFTESSGDGRQVDLRPRQFLVVNQVAAPDSADSQARLAECHQAVVDAEAALLKARAQLGLDPLLTPNLTPKPSRRPGN